MPTPQTNELNQTHAALVNIHKSLIDHERDRYARADRPLGSPLQFLNLLLTDPRFAWLHPLSELIIQIDQATSPKTPATPAQATALLTQTHTLLTPSTTAPPDSFQHHYHAALEESPTVSAAHAQWKRTQPAN